jgi:hypothetical protein
MIDFPATLPCFQAGHAYSQFNTVASSGMGHGLQGVKRIAPESSVYFPLSLLLTSAELETFDTWVETTLDYVNWFNATIKTANALEVRIVKFIKTDYQKQYLGGDYWRLNFELEAAKNNYFSADSLEFILAFGLPLDELPNFFNEFENIANADFYGVLP